MSMTNLNTAYKLLIENFIANNFIFESETKREKVINEALTITSAFVDENARQVEQAKNKITQDLKNELASKEFIKAEIAESKAGLGKEISNTRTELKQEIANVRAELKEEISNVRTELKEEIANVRTELKEGISNVRTELKEEISSVRTELKEEINGLRTELKKEIADIRVEFKDTKTDVIKWVFGIQIAGIGVIATLIKFL